MIVDDHILFAEALGAALRKHGMNVLGMASSGDRALALMETVVPDLTLMDLGLPDQGGLLVGGAILARWPEAKIIAMTALNDGSAVDQALDIGFCGYITKDTPVTEFAAALRQVMDGQLVVRHPMGRSTPRSTVERDASLLSSQLTPREREVLALLVEGLDGATVARRLAISRNTVRTHVQSILTKLQVHSRLQAATFAVRHGVVEVPAENVPG